MTGTRQILQDYCLLLAIYPNTEDDAKLRRLFEKKYANAFGEVSQLTQVAKNCAQNVCIAVTNDTPKLLKDLKDKIQPLKKGTFFLLSIDEASFKFKGPIKKRIEQHKVMHVQGLTAQKAFSLVNSGLKLITKEVKHYLKRNVLHRQKSAFSNIEFLQRFNALVKKHHSNPKLRTPFLAKELGISQSTLERRCLKLTGKKPNNLLLEYRLSRAFELAGHSRIQFSEIARACGFGSASYFSVRFTEFYNLKPSQVRFEKLRKTAS